MRKRINRFIDWFESKFNILIDIMALVGGAFCIFLAIFLFITLVSGNEVILDSLEYIIAPGIIGFFGVIILFALRITRHITKKEDQ